MVSLCICIYAIQHPWLFPYPVSVSLARLKNGNPEGYHSASCFARCMPCLLRKTKRSCLATRKSD